ncbi:MAG: hypothetical protein ACOX6H_01840 [Christensenellales bacterium]
MGTFVNVITESEKVYLGITEKPFSKVLDIEKKINLHRFMFESAYNERIVYFDTETNLLEKAGIILSKTITPEKAYFKIQRNSKLPKSFSRKKEMVFIHEVGAKDKVIDHAFFLTDGIKSLFTIQFTIDFENVLKNVNPTLIIENKNTIYKVLSGGGFKAKLVFQSSEVKNLRTKRNEPLKLLTVELDSPATQINAFNFFTRQIDKWCKELIPFEDNLFDYAQRITRPLPKKEKPTKEEKQALLKKKKKIDDQIIG